MRGFTAGAVLAAVAAGVAAQDCDVVDFNYYCNQVNKITYKNVVASGGSYNRITSMDSASGSCSSEPKSFSGPMQSLNEDLSFHFRGPGSLKQFAVYYPSETSSKVKARSPHSDYVKHGHQHFHQMMHEKREAEAAAPSPRAALPDGAIDAAGQPEYIVATINGDRVSWTNSLYNGGGAKPTPAPEPVTEPASTPKKHKSNKGASSPKEEKVSHSAKPASIIPGDWVRTSYYHAEKGIADDVTFLNNMGGSASGVFDMTFGNSLGYATSDGCGNAGSSQLLSDTLLPSNQELILMSGRKCADGDCGFTRPGGVAYHGWAGKNKAFFMEFSMPSDGKVGFNADMPAAWFLNAQIPRTLQYGNADCSCWTSGCGEFDVFETLASGETRMKSTMHGYYDGGDSDYFVRPTTGTMKAVVLFQDEEVHIKVLKGHHEFGTVMPQSDISSLCDTVEEVASSIFALITK